MFDDNLVNASLETEEVDSSLFNSLRNVAKLLANLENDLLLFALVCNLSIAETARLILFVKSVASNFNIAVTAFPILAILNHNLP